LSDLGQLIGEVHAELSVRLGEGQVANYIPELAKVPLERFGIAVATIGGEVFTAGDAAEPFSIQSISKLFTLTLALGKAGDSLWSRVGREPSGNRFNSIVQLEYEQGRPRNPFVNAGAIAVTDLILAGYRPKEAIGEIVRFVRFLAGDETIAIDPDVARSEQDTGFRNFALAQFMRSFNVITHSADEVLGVYFHQCAIAMDCAQLARSALFLAAKGQNPVTGRSVVSAARARRINSLMMMCGHYDGSGDFAFRVGLPGKSGVGGGIICVVPGFGTVAVWSPGLNSVGNSLIGSAALELLAQRANWSVFE
jgi:glutaminase